MSEFFSRVIDATVQVACLKELNKSESKIKEAFDKLTKFHSNIKADNSEIYKARFMKECSGTKCADAIREIYDALLGKGTFLDCDFLNHIYEGDATGTYEMGVRDQVVSKSAYLETLAVMGIIVESASYTI